MSYFERNERGATLILVAAALLMLMGFAAFAVDLSAAKNERRLDQGTVDAATLAGGLEIITGGGTAEAATAIRAYVDTNLNRILTDEDWNQCNDPEALPLSGVPGATVPDQPCISFGENDDGDPFARIRTVLPLQATATSFGRVLGVTELETTALAEIQLRGSIHSGAFPAGVFAAAGAGDSFCIKTGTSVHQSCGTSSTGDFGNFQPYFYQEVGPSNPDTICTSGNQPQPLSYVMATGIDHFLGNTATTPGSRVNGDDCPSFPGPAFPDRVDSGSGYSNSDVTNGLVSGGTYDGVDYSGRLSQKSWPGYGGATIFGSVVENRPLWKFIDISAPSLPTACSDAASGPATINDSDDAGQESAFQQARADMVACLEHPGTPDGLFVSELYQSPRLTIVPRYHQATPLGSNKCCYDILGFEVVFIDEVWTANGPSWECDGAMIDDPAVGFCRHSPGREGSIEIPAAGQQRVDSASAIVLSCGLLPDAGIPADEKCKRVENPDGSVSTVFLDLFLTK